MLGNVRSFVVGNVETTKYLSNGGLQNTRANFNHQIWTHAQAIQSALVAQTTQAADKPLQHAN